MLVLNKFWRSVLMLTTLWGVSPGIHGAGTSPLIDRRSDGDLVAMLSLTLDEKKLRHVWAMAADNPPLEVTGTAVAGDQVSTVLVFRGCQQDASGLCNLGVEFTLVTPTGQRVPGGLGVLWSAAPLAAPRFMLGSASMTLAFEPKDRGRTFQVEAVLHDQVADRSLTLSVPLRVE